VDVCRELLSIGATPLAAAAPTTTTSAAAADAAAAVDVADAAAAAAAASATSSAQLLGETAVDVGARLRLWDAVALFISSGKAGAVISTSRRDDGHQEPAAASASAAAVLAKVAAAAAALVDAASAGRAGVVSELLLKADGAVLAHQLAATAAPPAPLPPPAITPLHAVLTMSRDLSDNVANVASSLSAALLKLSRATSPSPSSCRQAA
jgi:hypothetical protein